MTVSDFYKTYFGFDPYRYQEEVFELLSKGKFPLLLKAPTGSGKTEAVLAPFLMQFIERKFTLAPRLIYVLPMRVLVNSLKERIETYAEKISPAISVKAQHGDLPDSPFFMADIVVTTLDQFLYAFARASSQVGKHLDIPAGAIASSLVVFDEAHMYRDEFTFSIMRALLEILNHSRIPFILMTATLPKSLEKSLFENIELAPEQRIVLSNWTSTDTSIEIELCNEPLIRGEVVNLSEELLREVATKKTLIVLNQVGRAQRLYEELKRRLDDTNIVLLHSRFRRVDRETHEKEALRLLPHKEEGKLVKPEGASVIISTQVLEAGIDFSAELLLTELAPADCLIQRAGRCARYSGERGKVLIFPVEEENRGHLPYEKRHLENTWKWLKANKNFNPRDFSQVCRFVDETLDYVASDYEARDILIDLYECTLYADYRPENIQLRKNKSVTILVVDKEPERSKRGDVEAIRKAVENILQKGSYRDYSFEVDIKIAWSWFRKGLIKYELVWYPEKEKTFDIRDLHERGREATEEDPRISPFKVYIIESVNYDPDRGVVYDEALFV